MEGTTEVFTAESSSDLIASIVGVVLPLELGADGCEVETLAPAEGCGGGGGFGGADIACSMRRMREAIGKEGRHLQGLRGTR